MMDDTDPMQPPAPLEPAQDFLGGEEDLTPPVPEFLVNKGDYIDIRGKVPELKEIAVNAGWDHKAFEDNPIDVDLSCFMINKDDQTRVDEDFVFYNNDRGCDGAVRYMGDSRSGAGDGDDECLIIDLSGLPFDILKIVFTLTIYQAAEKGQEFGQVRSPYIRLINALDDTEILRYRINQADFAGQTGIKVAELVREGPKWFFSVLGENISGGLGPIATKYGIIVQM